MNFRPLAATMSLALLISTVLAACGGGDGNGGGSAPPPSADTTPPTTTIDTQPAPLTPDIVATFTFSASETATFETSLDGAAYTPATSPLNLTALAEGTHTLLVRARDAAGNLDVTPARASWVIALPAVDTTPPTTTIDFGPPILTISPNAVFMFSSSEMESTFEASLDGGPFVDANTIPYEIAGLAEGLHFIAVQSRDAAGNVDPTPAFYQWLIQNFTGDITPPTTTIDSQPPPVSTSNSALFTFSSSENSTYECAIDGAAFTPCQAFLMLSALAEGPHTLSVRARDMSGIPDDTPATAQWIVATPAPDTVFTSGPGNVTRSTSAIFAFFSNDSTSTFEGSFDGAAYAPVTQPVVFDGLAQGTHTFALRARSAAGVVDSTPATYTWAVDRVPPTARIAFPTAVGSTNSNSIAVRGHANDAHGLGGVRVNGVLAYSIDGFETWRAEVPLAPGANTIEVSVTDAVGNVANGAATAVITFKGEPIYTLRGIDYDSTADRLIVADRALNLIHTVSLEDGYTRVLSPASGNPNYRISDLAVDAIGNRALVVESYLDALIGVDLTTGVRTVVAPASLATADTHFTDGSVIAVDIANDRAFVTRPGNGSVIGIDLATGTRSVITSGTIGNGTPLAGGAGIAYDDITTPGTPRLLVSEGVDGSATPAHIVAVDIASGDRTVQSSLSENVGTGAFIDTPGALELDVANHRLLVLDAAGGQVVAVGLATGSRTLVSAETEVPSIGNTRGMAFVPTASRLLVARPDGAIISIDNSSRRSTLVSTAVGSGVAMNYPEGLIIEQREGTPASLLTTDAANQTLMRVNLATGARTVVSSSAYNVGTGPSLSGMVDVILDTRPGWQGTVLALVGDPNYSIVAIELPTGNRATVASLNAPIAGAPFVPAVTAPRNLRLDAANNRVYFSDTTGGGNTEALYNIDLQSGDRTTVTSGAKGVGPLFDRASNFVLDFSSQPVRAILADEGPGGMLAVDLVTGDRSVFLMPWAEDPQPGASVAGASFLDTEFSRLIANRAGTTSNLFSVSLTSGQQTILSGQDPVAGTIVGRGPTPYGAMALDVSAGDGVAFTGNAWIGAIFAIDLVSGDRVMIAR